MTVTKLKIVTALMLAPGILAAAVQYQALASPETTATVDDKPDVKQAQALLDKAIKAMGGEAKLAKLKTGSCEGKLTGNVDNNELTVACKISWDGLGKNRLECDITHGTNKEKLLVVLNGESLWVVENQRVVDLMGDRVPFLRELNYCVRLPELLPMLKDKAFPPARLEETKIGEQEAVGVWFAHKDHRDVGLYFDKADGLPLKSEIRLKDPSDKEVTFEFFFKNYEETAGIKHPTKIKIKGEIDNKDQEFDLELTEIKCADKLDAGLFEKP